jgi:hypothetical protein
MRAKIKMILKSQKISLKKERKIYIFFSLNSSCSMQLMVLDFTFFLIRFDYIRDEMQFFFGRGVKTENNNK